jgi:hypothetical protein
MRKLWIDSLLKISLPVLDLASKNQLKEKMPSSKNCEQQYLEAIARTICGVSPWLNLPDDSSKEAILRTDIKSKVKDTLSNIVEPKSSDYLDFGQDKQSLVDAAYLAQGLIRCPSLFEELPKLTQKKLISEIKKTRQFEPPETNWLLFAAMTETFLLSRGEVVVVDRLSPAIDKFLNIFYVGDGQYGDGMQYHFDYYNSFVIHPMLTDILEVMQRHKFAKAETMLQLQQKRHQRYAEILERMISPTGTWPLIGRTLTCRIGAFHALSHAAYKGFLPGELHPSQVRCALNAVLQTFISCKQNFDKKGFLTVGLCGEQASVAESYISAGSAYHAVTFFVALGLPVNHDFWTKPNSEWSSLIAFSGGKIKPDHAYDEFDGVKAILVKFFKQIFSIMKKRFKR